MSITTLLIGEGGVSQERLLKPGQRVAELAFADETGTSRTLKE